MSALDGHFQNDRPVAVREYIISPRQTHSADQNCLKRLIPLCIFFTQIQNNFAALFRLHSGVDVADSKIVTAMHARLTCQLDLTTTAPQGS